MELWKSGCHEFPGWRTFPRSVDCPVCNENETGLGLAISDDKRPLGSML